MMGEGDSFFQRLARNDQFEESDLAMTKGGHPVATEHHKTDTTPKQGMRKAGLEAGLNIPRHFTASGVDPYEEVSWAPRSASIVNDHGEVVFEQKEVAVPSFWSQTATNVVVSKYFRGALGTPERENSVRQLVGRVVNTITDWGIKDGYFATSEDAENFRAELAHLMLMQKASFNSPVWFNVGIELPRPQCSACFILSVKDTMESILDWYKVEGMIFKYGSGAGINLSSIRSCEERLAGGGTASGPVSFMRAADASAGVIKSGGKCFKQGTLVATPTGWKPIESLQSGEQVLTHRGPRPVADFMANGQKQCYRVRTHEGYEVEVTEGHKFAYWNMGDGRFETKPIECFEPGESLYLLLQPSLSGSSIPLRTPAPHDPPNATTIEEMTFPGELTDEFAYVLGLIYGDGELRTEYPYRVRVAFAKDSAGQASAFRFKALCRKLFGEEPIVLGDEPGHQQIGFTRKRLVEFLVANGLAKGKAHSLQFPQVLFQARPEIRAAFIAGFIDADGTYQKRGGWSISSIDRAFLLSLQRLLLTLGIPSKIKLNREQVGTWQRLYKLHVVGYTFVERLVRYITPHSAKAHFNFEPSDGADKGWGYRPSLFSVLAARAENGSGRRLVDRRVGSSNETTGYGALAVLADHPDAVVAEYAQELSNCVQVALEVVEPTEIAETYDIEVEDTHLLSANGFYASNTRRAAKMLVLNADHPDIERFIQCKWLEEQKAWKLMDAGYDSSLGGEAYASVFFQNANNSVRATDAFMEAAAADRPWDLKTVHGDKTHRTTQAKELLKLIAEATWHCGDPGMQFDTTINRWNTCANSGRINASNPCSEFMSIDNTSCNLASLNLMKFVDQEGTFQISDLRSAVRTMTVAMDIIVDNASYPTPEITENAHLFRQLGLGYANLGALLMSLGLPYDSDAGRAYAATVTALLCAESYRTSAEMAEVLGPYEGFSRNKEPQLNVIRMHRDALVNVDDRLVPERLFAAAAQTWDEVLRQGSDHGMRNSQAVVLAPTGTIGFMMDCDTTGVEPDIALVKYKKLVDGGLMKIVNQTVSKALKRLGYDESQIRMIIDHLNQHETIEGAPGLDPKHLDVFDCAFKPLKGTRFIHYMGHVRMMGAVQPFVSGAISKTVNVPAEATVDEIMKTYTESWRLGVKAIAIYRDGSKRVQPLTTAKDKSGGKKVKEKQEAPIPGTAPDKPQRHYLADERHAITHKFSIAGHDGYVTVGLYDNGKPGEIFIVMSKEGTVISGLLDAFATAISLALQYGVPLEALVKKFSHMRFEPAGITSNPKIRFAQSILDYVFRWLALRFLPSKDHPSPPVTVTDLAAKEADVTTPSKTAGTTSDAQPTRQAFQGEVDAPPCPDCGAMMVRSGNCHKCFNCGSTLGCS